MAIKQHSRHPRSSPSIGHPRLLFAVTAIKLAFVAYNAK